MERRRKKKEEERESTVYGERIQMGNSISSGTLFPTLDLTQEVEESLNQIIQAFNHEFPFESRRSKTNRQLQAISSTADTQNSEPIKPLLTRSHSADEYQPEEHQRTPKIKLSNIKRQWQCQLCHTKNENDVLICFECGSNKINVYIPIIDRMETDQRERNPSAFSSSSAPVRYSDNDLDLNRKKKYHFALDILDNKIEIQRLLKMKKFIDVVFSWLINVNVMNVLF